MKKQKITVLLFPSFITGICEVLGVQFEESDKRMNNEETITMKIVERITGESTAAATPEQLATDKTEQATRIENML